MHAQCALPSRQSDKLHEGNWCSPLIGAGDWTRLVALLSMRCGYSLICHAHMHLQSIWMRGWFVNKVGKIRIPLECNKVGSRLGEGGVAACSLRARAVRRLIYASFNRFQPVNKYKCCLPLGAVQSQQSITVNGRWRCNLQLPRRALQQLPLWFEKVLPTYWGRSHATPAQPISYEIRS